MHSSVSMIGGGETKSLHSLNTHALPVQRPIILSPIQPRRRLTLSVPSLRFLTLIASADGRERKRAPRDDTWRTKTLSELEQELLGIEPKGSSKPPPQQAKRPRDPLDENYRPRKNADGSEWSLLDEMEEKIGFRLPNFDDNPVVQQTLKIGEWLDKKTIADPDAEISVTGPILVAVTFPIWLYLVLVSAGVVHLPAVAKPLEDFLTQMPIDVPESRLEAP
eukprot:TRINITY_DN35701_c0_g1_i1.p1 TRINITY_DN35701_c0_g1~~TRINITY_DN35701_c0_g1_i1.p1  ORF type:complete len:221 (+),score=16.21 TRINITY_DN35701_c0_g1_i1:326-988(+)